MFRSATFKLTVWYMAIVMTICLIFSLVLYQATTNELSRGLHRETERIYNNFPIFENNPLLRPGDDYSRSAHRILVQLVGFNVIVLVGAGFASYWLARRTLEPIEEAHERQKRFTADVSHELRTPLTALKMESEVALLNQTASKTMLRETLTSTVEEANKLEQLINNLMRLAELDNDALQQSFTDCSITEILDDSVDQIKQAAESKNITVELKLQESKVFADANQLTQLFVILLDNAIKFSPNGKKVVISSHKSGERIQIKISDKGAGIDRAALEHVFDRFYRADSSRSRSTSEGHGLGLSIAKMIADIHDGTITLTSKVKHGTTATVSLPLNSPPTGSQ